MTAPSVTSCARAVHGPDPTGERKRKQPRNLLVPPRVATFDLSNSRHCVVSLEYSIHKCSPRFLWELAFTFPQFGRLKGSPSGKPTNPAAENAPKVLIVPTFQKSRHSLVAIGPEIEEEKDEMLETFLAWANNVRDALVKAGHWADMTDPSSGYPVHSPRGPSYFSDVAACQYLLKYPVMTTGCCNVLTHPQWETNFYPALFFTTAPLDVLQSVLNGLELN
ncbi:hypothetical protein IWQ62_004010 [Dispira parvispora]|uniref:Uncharacterized protein n=1 Tax=Dispira parvispora TaxID=1520584 RepID=A0A9W8ALR7_9FUNG|nr:hypothetical protein IWQ62_004010 [Dispira parvispora]